SGRRRHTIWVSDWSSDVCSSDLKALTITAKSLSKTYGLALTFAGTEFTTSGLVNNDTVTSATLSSAGAAAGASVAGSPYPVTIRSEERRVGKEGRTRGAAHARQK